MIINPWYYERVQPGDFIHDGGEFRRVTEIREIDGFTYVMLADGGVIRDSLITDDMIKLESEVL